MRHYFEYFPGNHMWSLGVLFGAEMQTWGAAAFGEIDQIGQRLKGHEGDNAAWFREWRAMADRMAQKAAESVSLDRPLTAGTYFLHAFTYYFVAERYCPPGDDKNEAYRQCLRCFYEGTKRRWPNLDRVEVPYEGTHLPAYFMKSPVVKGPAPTVVMFDGLDSSKEVNAIYGGIELLNRGINCLVIDGPGQGEALRLQNLHSRFDYEVPGSAAYDFVSSRPDVDPRRVAVAGVSMGGYYAPRIAAFERRYAACIAWGGHYDYHQVWIQRRKVLESGGTKISAPDFQLTWVLGAGHLDEAMQRLERFTLEGIAQKITCPLLVVHGENDTIVPLDVARKLYDSASSKKKELKVFTTDDGGSEHCQGDNRHVGANFIADWVAENL